MESNWTPPIEHFALLWKGERMEVHINKTAPFIFFIFPDSQLKFYGNWHF